MIKKSKCSDAMFPYDEFDEFYASPDNMIQKAKEKISRKPFKNDGNLLLHHLGWFSREKESLRRRTVKKLNTFSKCQRKR